MNQYEQKFKFYMLWEIFLPNTELSATWEVPLSEVHEHFFFKEKVNHIRFIARVSEY